MDMEMPGYRVIIEERIFDDMDRNNNDLIDWWEFVIPMCVRKLSERRKVLIIVWSVINVVLRFPVRLGLLRESEGCDGDRVWVRGWSVKMYLTLLKYFLLLVQVTFCCNWPKLISSNEINLNSEMKMQQKKPEKSGFGISPRDEAIYPVQGHL